METNWHKLLVMTSTRNIQRKDQPPRRVTLTLLPLSPKMPRFPCHLKAYFLSSVEKYGLDAPLAPSDKVSNGTPLRRRGIEIRSQSNFLGLHLFIRESIINFTVSGALANQFVKRHYNVATLLLELPPFNSSQFKSTSLHARDNIPSSCLFLYCRADVCKTWYFAVFIWLTVNCPMLYGA
jgi:hypothetical protein